MPDDAIQVVLLAKGYFLSTDQKGGQKGQKVFHEAAFNPRSDLAVSLPAIGDPFSDSAPNCLVVNIEMTYLGDTTNCGRIWTIEYLNDIQEPDEEVSNPNEEDLQTTIELGSEAISYTPPAGVWRWYAGGAEIVMPMYARINTATVKVYRTIWNNKLDLFLAQNFYKMGKINSDVFWGIPNYMLYYEGANLQETRDEDGDRIWKAEMTFTFRTVTGNFTMGKPDIVEGGQDGWNWVIRDTDTMTATEIWGKPYKTAPADHMFIYQATEFKPLLTVAGKTVKFPDLSWMA